MAKVYEVNFDGLIGPTHNFSGLAFGNQAAMAHQFDVSHPKKAALEGLSKMKLCHSLGIKQGFIPPPLRPNLELLKERGYEGSGKEVLAKAAQEDPELLRVASSASSMWTANAATVSPSVDSGNGHVHLTTASLITHPHRAQEAEETYRALQMIFADDVFSVHPPLSGSNMLDEGAANHMRLAADHASPGIHVFVYGRQQKLPARQSWEACQHIAQNHQLNPDHAVFVQQNPDAIDAGVFHNDVIATSNENLLLVHEEAFVDTEKVVAQISTAFKRISQKPLMIIRIDPKQLSLEEAIRSYLFNSQIVTCPDGRMVLIAPMEVRIGQANETVAQILKGSNPIQDVHYVSLKESMANGGGPACLRLRVVLSEDQLKAVHPGYLLDAGKFVFLASWINTHYREELHIRDLSSAQLYEEGKAALQELKTVFELP